jgi:ketosteroid isomerase-like protein
MKVLGVVGLAICVCMVSFPSDAQTVKGLPQADVAKIEQAGDTWVKGALSQDWASVAALYVDDAAMNPPNEPATNGRAAIRAWLQKFPRMTSFKIRRLKVDGRDDLAFVLATYAMTFVPPGAPGPISDSGKYVEVWRKQPDGKWLIAVDIFNSDLAPTPPSPAK